MNLFSTRVLYRIDEAEEWVRRLEPSGGCNLLRAVKHILNVKDVDYILIVLGSV